MRRSKKIQTPNLFEPLLLLMMVLSCPLSWCLEVNQPSPMASGTTLPSYEFPYKNGLYATVTGFLKVKNVKLPNERTFKLAIKTFNEKVPVQAVVQDHPAPLVVILLGISGRANADFCKLWPSWYAEAGYHVLAFDSTFRPEFVKISGHGVSGNIWAESERVGAIIDAFLKLNDVRNKVSKVGIAGMSYGAVQALMLGRMAAQGRLPFEVAGIQAYSPPLKLEKTAELLDRWYSEDRWQYTLTELKEKVGGHTPSDSGEHVPLSESMMRAAVSSSFRLELVDVILRNDEYFKLNLLPRGDSFDDKEVRKDYAATWGFMRFAYDLALPYWQKRLGASGINELVQGSHLSELLRAQPRFSETILAADDPFNAPEDLSELKSIGAQLPMTILPHGGHLGFIDNPWTKAKLMTLFDSDGEMYRDKTALRSAVISSRNARKQSRQRHTTGQAK